jgi:hypothetical protein
LTQTLMVVDSRTKSKPPRCRVRSKILAGLLLPILVCGAMAASAKGKRSQGSQVGPPVGSQVQNSRAAIGSQDLPDPALQIERIQQEVAEIRGLPFKSAVKAAKQTTAEFNQRLAAEIDKELPSAVAPYYGQIIRKLGLYRGPLISNARGMMQSMLVSQVAAYYEPKQNTFFVLMDEASGTMQGALYAHELFHGLQHQQFDLSRYMGDAPGKLGLNQDELLARQAVVEGEATYVMTLWTVKNAVGLIPDRASLEPIVAMQSQLDIKQMRAMLAQPEMAKLLGDDMQASLDAAEKTPTYLIQTLIGAYLKGMAFVFAVERGGWQEVSKLYDERPPASTEQILHPEKWFADERPIAFEWPSFEQEPALREWQLLDQNVLGEFQWRIIFQEHGLRSVGEVAAAGWNGDRYAVLKAKGSDALLLLLRTSWDTDKDATEFAEAYRRLLTVKYAAKDVKYATVEPSRVLQQGKEVTIVEGGTPRSIDSLLRFAGRATKVAPAIRK